MRSFDEIREDLKHANDINDVDALLRYAQELDNIDAPLAKAASNRTHGKVLRLRSDHHGALERYNRALAIYQELGDRNGVAGVTGDIGKVRYSLGDYPAALEYHHRALALHQELDNGIGIAVDLCDIGNVYKRTGDYPAALEHYHRALALYEKHGYLAGVATNIGNIGNVYQVTGDYPAALEHHLRALALYEELGDRSGVASVTGNAGNVYSSTSDYSAALEHHHRALALYEELGNRSGVARIAGNIGTVYARAANYPTAIEWYNRALALYEELGEQSGVTMVMSNIVSAYLDMGSGSEAQSLLAVMDAMQIDEPGVRITREQHHAALQVLNNDLEGASQTLQRALVEAREHKIRSVVAEVHKALRDLALKQNDLAGYVEHNNEFTRINEEINGKDTATKLAMQAKQREIEARDRETEKHMAVLHSTLPKHIADRVAKGETINDHYDNAAVMFIDIVGFTSISSTLTSQHVTTLLDAVFGICDDACRNNNATRIKTVGDSYLAFGN